MIYNSNEQTDKNSTCGIRSFGAHICILQFDDDIGDTPWGWQVPPFKLKGDDGGSLFIPRYYLPSAHRYSHGDPRVSDWLS